MKKNLLLLLSTLLIMFFLGEVASRMWSHFVNPVTKYPDKIAFAYFPYLPYTPAPGYKNEHRGISNNSRGFRNSYEFLSPKPSNVYRIVCMGGSTTYSDYDHASNEEVWTGRLENYLNQNSSSLKFEVINASASNYTTYMNLIDYLTRVRDLEVDMVILYEGVNELYYNGFDSVSFAHSNVFQNFDSDKVNRLLYRMNHNFFLQNSELLKRIYAMIFIDHLNLNFMMTKTVHYNAEHNINNMKMDSLLTFEKGLKGFIGLSKVDNFKLIFLSQAYQFSKLRAELKHFNKSINPQSVKDYILETDRVKAKMEEVALENNIPFLDMNKVLSQEKSYFVKDPYDAVHFSRKGDEFFGRSLYSYIKSYISLSQ